MYMCIYMCICVYVDPRYMFLRFCMCLFIIYFLHRRCPPVLPRTAVDVLAQICFLFY